MTVINFLVFIRALVSIQPCLFVVGGLLRFEKKPFLKNKKIKIFNKAFLCTYPAN